MTKDTRRDKRTPIALKVRFKSATVSEFIDHYSQDISKGGIFIKSKSPMPVGTLLKFEFQLKDNSPLIQGVGRVVWKRDENPARPDQPPGMGIKFIKMDERSRMIVEKIVSGKPEGQDPFEEHAAFEASAASPAAPVSASPAEAQDRPKISVPRPKRQVQEEPKEPSASPEVGGAHLDFTVPPAVVQPEIPKPETPKEVLVEAKPEPVAKEPAKPAPAKVEEKPKPAEPAPKPAEPAPKPAAAPQPAQKTKGLSAATWVVLLLVMGAIGAGVIYYVYTLKSATAPESPSAPVAAPSQPAPPAQPAPAAPQAATAPAEAPAPEAVAPAKPAAPLKRLLKVSSDPDGAGIYINDVLKGKTPADITALPPGDSFSLVVKKSGFNDTTLEVGADQWSQSGNELTAEINVTLEKIEGRAKPRGGKKASAEATPAAEAAPAPATEAPKAAAPAPVKKEEPKKEEAKKEEPKPAPPPPAEKKPEPKKAEGIPENPF